MAKGLSRMAKPKVGVWSVRRFRRSLRRNGFKTRNVNYRIFVYQTHTWVIQGVFMEQEQAIDELRSTSSDQEASEIKYAKTMNISKLWISRNLPASYLRSIMDIMHDLRLFWDAKGMNYHMVSPILHDSTMLKPRNSQITHQLAHHDRGWSPRHMILAHHAGHCTHRLHTAA